MSRDFTFIHTSDTHLGANWPAIASRDKVQIPFFGEAFGQVVNFAIEKHVDFVVHSGDLIDHPRPSVAAVSRLLDELKKLQEEGIDFIVTKGSHDSSRGFFERLGGNWLYLLENKLSLLRYVDVGLNQSVDVKTDDNSVVRIYGLGDYGNQQEEMLNQLIPTMSSKGSDYGVLMIHGSILEMPKARGAVIPLSKITPLIGSGLVDYVALGHNHQRWEDETTLALNPGSTEFTSFAEASKSTYVWIGGALQLKSVQESPKGFYFVRVEGEITTPEFKLLQTRDVRDVIVEFVDATPQNIIEGLVAALQKHSHPRAILRPIAYSSSTIPYRATDVKISEIAKAISNALYIAYPILNLQGITEPLVRYATGTSYQLALEQAFSAKYKSAAREVSGLANAIVESYWTMGQMASTTVLQQVESFNLSCLKAEEKQKC